jgi:hypothetical protein
MTIIRKNLQIHISIPQTLFSGLRPLLKYFSANSLYRKGRKFFLSFMYPLMLMVYILKYQNACLKAAKKNPDFSATEIIRNLGLLGSRI